MPLIFGAAAGAESFFAEAADDEVGAAVVFLVSPVFSCFLAAAGFLAGAFFVSSVFFFAGIMGDDGKERMKSAEGEGPKALRLAH